MSLTDHDERRFLKHLQHATSTCLDVSIEDPELLDDLSDPVLDGGDVDVDSEGEVELVVDGVHVAQLLEEHRPLHVARGRRRRSLPSFRLIGGVSSIFTVFFFFRAMGDSSLSIKQSLLPSHRRRDDVALQISLTQSPQEIRFSGKTR